MKRFIEVLINDLFKAPSEEQYNSILSRYLASNEYNPYEELHDFRDLLESQIENEQYSALIKTCYEILKVKPFDIEAHIIIARFSTIMNKPSLSSLHNYIANLRKHNLCNNTGKSLTEAVQIIYPEDEIFFFKINNLQPTKRISHETGDNFYDIYSFANSHDMFFNITIPFLKAVSDNDNQES